MKNADLAVLGLLMEQPRHGYEIEQVIQVRDMRDWTEIGFSSIYAILARLQKQGLLRATLQPPQGRGPARKVFRITRAGRAAWKQATLRALSTLQHGGAPFLLGLAGLPGLSVAEAATALQEYRNHLTERLDQLAARRPPAGAEMPVFLAGMFDYGRALAQAEIDWLDRFIPKLTGRKPGRLTRRQGR